MMKTYVAPEAVYTYQPDSDILTLSVQLNNPGDVWDLSGNDLFG